VQDLHSDRTKLGKRKAAIGEEIRTSFVVIRAVRRNSR
jgi:hypothetical protein